MPYWMKDFAENDDGTWSLAGWHIVPFFHYGEESLARPIKTEYLALNGDGPFGLSLDSVESIPEERSFHSLHRAKRFVLDQLKEPPTAEQIETAALREQFETFYRAHFGSPVQRVRLEEATIVGTEDPFFWVEHHPSYPDLKPNYYWSDVAAQWAMFRAVWEMAKATCPTQP